MMVSQTNPAIEPHAEQSEKAQSQGLNVSERRTILALEGMTCASCAIRIEKGLKKVPGVLDVSVNLATELANVTFNPAQTDIERLVQKVEAVGYKALPQETPLLKAESQTGAVSADGTTPLPVTVQ